MDFKKVSFYNLSIEYKFVPGPAPDAVTNKIYELTTGIKSYSSVVDLKCPIDKIGTQNFKVSFLNIYFYFTRPV